MALHADRGTGGHGDNSWTQPANGFWDPKDDTTVFADPNLMQLGNDLWSLENDTNFDGNFANSFTMQAEVGADEASPKFPNHINNLVANGNDPRGYSDANIPRGDVAMEQIQALVTPVFQVADSNLGSQHLWGNEILAEEGQDEPVYVTHTNTPHVTKVSRKNCGPRSDEWQKRKSEIYSLYVVDNYTLEVTRKKMAEKGFYAESVAPPFIS